MATISPRNPITCPIGTSGGRKPDRAHTGSGPSVRRARQPAAPTGATPPPSCALAWREGDDDAEWLAGEHPATAATARRATTHRTRALIAKPYAVCGTTPRRRRRPPLPAVPV